MLTLVEQAGVFWSVITWNYKIQILFKIKWQQCICAEVTIVDNYAIISSQIRTTLDMYISWPLLSKFEEEKQLLGYDKLLSSNFLTSARVLGLSAQHHLFLSDTTMTIKRSVLGKLESISVLDTIVDNSQAVRFPIWLALCLGQLGSWRHSTSSDKAWAGFTMCLPWIFGNDRGSNFQTFRDDTVCDG